MQHFIVKYNRHITLLYFFFLIFTYYRCELALAKMHASFFASIDIEKYEYVRVVWQQQMPCIFRVWRLPHTFLFLQLRK